MSDTEPREKAAEQAEFSESLISQSPSRRVGDKTFITVPGPVGPVGVRMLERRRNRRK